MAARNRQNDSFISIIVNKLRIRAKKKAEIIKNMIKKTIKFCHNLCRIESKTFRLKTLQIIFFLVAKRAKIFN